MRRLLFGALVVIGGICWGQSDPYGSNHTDYLNVRLTATVAIPRITEDGLKISGSNVYVATQATAKTHVADPPPANPVAHVRMYKVTLTIGGQQVFQDTDDNINWNDEEDQTAPRGPSALPDLDPDTFPLLKEPRDAYFASTHFDDGASLPVTLAIEFKFKLQDGTIDPHTETVTTTITPTVHNRAVVWRTNVGGIGGGQIIELIPPISDWVHADYLALKANFEAAKYTVEGNEMASRTAITNNLGIVTAIAAETHGSTLGVCDSDGIGSAYTIAWEHATDPDFHNKLIVNGNRYAATLTQSMMPPVSLVIFYACTTYPYALPSYMWLWRSPLSASSPVIDGAILGYGQDTTWSSTTDDHINLLFSELAAGKCIRDAIAEADRVYGQPARAGSRDSTVPMVVHGDKYATLSNVYLPEAIRDAPGNVNTTFHDWKRVVPETW